MKHIKAAMQWGAISLAIASSIASATTVDVYGHHANLQQGLARVPGIQVRIHVVDSAAVIEEQLSAAMLQAGVLSQPQSAKSYMLSPVGLQWTQRLKAAWDIPFQAFNRGVRKVPAIVVDDRYVVYGTLDLVRALRTVNAYRRQEVSR